MSDPLDAALAADEARYRDPVVKSDVTTPATVGAGGEPVTEPVEVVTETKVEPEKPADAKPEAKVEDDGEKERAKRNRDAESQRWARMTAKLGDADRNQERMRAEADSLRAEIARLQAANKPASTEEGQSPTGSDAKPLSQADIERMVDERAASLVQKQQRDAETRKFNEECNRVAADGEKEYGEDFQPALSGMFAMAGSPQVGTALIEAALETDTPHAVLYHLGKNPADVMRLIDLKPTKLGAAVAKIAAGLASKSEVAPPRQEISRAPAPLAPVTGGARVDAGAMGPKNMSDWMKWDAEQSKRR